jgi:hypothetical protein
MWRMIDVCKLIAIWFCCLIVVSKGMGAKPLDYPTLPDDHSPHPSVLDLPNMEGVFTRIYKLMSPFAKK